MPFIAVPPNACLFSITRFFTVDRKSSQTKTFSQNMICMFCLYHFSLNSIIKNFYLSSDHPLKTIDPVEIFKNCIFFQFHIVHMFTISIAQCEDRVSNSQKQCTGCNATSQPMLVAFRFCVAFVFNICCRPLVFISNCTTMSRVMPCDTPMLCGQFFCLLRKKGMRYQNRNNFFYNCNFKLFRFYTQKIIQKLDYTSHHNEINCIVISKYITRTQHCQISKKNCPFFYYIIRFQGKKKFPLLTVKNISKNKR